MNPKSKIKSKRAKDAKRTATQTSKVKRVTTSIPPSDSAKPRLIAQFPEADESDLREANKSKAAPRPQYEHYTADGKGFGKRVDAPPKDGYFKTPAEGRAKGVMPKSKKIKFKHELWSGRTMQAFFRINSIHADTTQWNITFNKPARKMTAADQLVLMMAGIDTEYTVAHNFNDRYVVIHELNPLPF